MNDFRGMPDRRLRGAKPGGTQVQHDQGAADGLT
jgi:hypothetical protein